MRDDMIGEKYGRWTVLYPTENTRKVHCRCECGNEADVYKTNLKRGISRSCGCYKVEKAIQDQTTHKGTGTRVYRIWRSMRRRCLEKDNPRYGGRGIKVCPEWDNDFITFRNWMLSQGYDENHPKGEQTIDRIDNDGDYCPENCRLANIKQQSANRSTRRELEYNGMSMSITEWNEKMGYPHGCIDNRIRKGWSIERAITEAPKRRVSNA